MGAAAEEPGIGALVANVRLVEDPALAYELTRRLPRPDEPRPVSVTELLDPRRAYWRRLRGPAPVPLERELRMEQGRVAHRRLGDAVAADGRLEVRLRRGGLSGRIDLLADVPVEIKSAPGERSPAPDWPDQIEQLAAYCLLVGQPVGRLVHVALTEGSPPVLSVTDLRFRDLEEVGRELHRRESDLRSALRVGTPVRLGRCRWFGLGCEYRAHGVCDCSGDEAPESSSIREGIGERNPRPEIAARWSDALRVATAAPRDPVARFRDLLYPRRTYFDRTSPRATVAVPPRPAAAPPDMYERTVGALELGPVGEFHRLPTGGDAPEEEVLAWKGEPCLLRTTRARLRLTPDDLLARYPQYLVELGFRGAHTGRDRGWLLLGHDAPAPGEPALQVFRVELPGGPSAWGRAWEARRAWLERAVSSAAPERLTACPSWMTFDCPYRSACGCATAPGRSQR